MEFPVFFIWMFLGCSQEFPGIFLGFSADVRDGSWVFHLVPRPHHTLHPLVCRAVRLGRPHLITPFWHRMVRR